MTTNLKRRLPMAAITLIVASAATWFSWGAAPVSPRRSGLVASPGGSGAASATPSPATTQSSALSAAEQERAQERAEVIAFFDTYAPNRFKRMYSRMKDTPSGEKLLQRMTLRYRNLMRIKSEDMGLYEIMLKQMTLQDDAFQLLRRQQSERGEGRDLDASSLDELRAKVRELVDLSLVERQRRIDRLEKMLADQKSKLETDKNKRDALVDQHMKQMMQDSKDFQRLWFSPVGGGGNNPRGR